MLQIIVHVWGDMYGDEYIERLRSSIDKYTTVPWNLHVIRDHENGWEKYCKKNYRGKGKPHVVQGEGFQNGYHHYNLGGLPLYKKMYPWFMTDHCSEKDTIMYLDIDVEINGDLKYFTKIKLNKPWVQYDYDIDPDMLIQDYRNQNITPINTSVLVFRKGQMDPVLKVMDEMTDRVFFTYRRVDAFVWYEFGVKDFFNFLPKEIVDWHYKDSRPLISNMAGEPIEIKDKVIREPSKKPVLIQKQSWLSKVKAKLYG